MGASSLAFVAAVLLAFPGAAAALVWDQIQGTGNTLCFVLKAAFWLGVGAAGAWATAVSGVFWAELVAERHGKKRKGITLKEILTKKLDFERWCD